MSKMYEQYAKDYEQAIADNIYNGNLERPSLIAMLPELAGKQVLDLGCGPGVYAEYLIEQGATVTAVDASQAMVDIVREKFGEGVRAYAQDLSQGLPEEQNASYDVIICPLTVHYIEDVSVLFRDVKRLLKKGGVFIFSTHHPVVDFEVSPSGNYFKRELIQEEWDTIGHPVEVSFYRRSLTEWFESLAASGLCVTLLSEGKPSERMKTLCPDSYKKLSTTPNFIFFKCESR
ncbi:class I SAM-dependent DNA methyltransferase [Endozoicomonas arenosclerae]|uniref:class I SAM-dependent DNA methyltransferase n=1 Tax=Endozoicomonas arenosclerae TaxID=1633495 RepID=UPI0007862D8A|nr:class I SAM-dependent methyltransferase [Endozoicomonas arenosclerae]